MDNSSGVLPLRKALSRATWGLVRGCGSNVCFLALLADEAEELDGAGSGGTEPVWGAGVELGDFSGLQDQVVFAEDQTESAVEDDTQS